MDDQTTTYTYGTTLTDSDIARNDLLANVAYPDSTGSSDTVTTTYNRLGQKKTVTDQRGVVHSYEYDKLGRQTMDGVTTCPAGVDSSVLGIGTTYDVRGRVEHVTSYDSDDNSGVVLNDVQMEYNGFNQVTKEYQSHSGAVNTSTTPKVQYGYEPGNVSTTQTNNIRPTTLTYPNGRVITYQYGTADGLNDYLNRANEIYDTTNSQSLAQYVYLGSGLAVRVIYPEPEVMLDLWGLSETTGQFDGLDQFNRVTDQNWLNDINGSPTTIDQYTYTYDRNNNRLTRGNGTHPAFSEAYTYDNLNRLTSMDRGTGGTLNFTEDWVLDETGNWLNYDTTSDGTTPILSQTRTANEANEITDITSTPTWADPRYDAAGNITGFPDSAAPSSAITASYDSWNRLVETNDGVGPLSAFAYDGRSRRVVRQEFTSHVPSATRHWYFDRNWRAIEHRLNSGSSADRAFLWGLRVIDDPTTKAKAVANDCLTVSKPNGCGGSGGVTVPAGPNNALLPCCNAHDTCYGTCGMNKATCDHAFCTCMDDRCRAIKHRGTRNACYTMAGAFCYAVKNHGQDYYNQGQRYGCGYVYV